jgi:pimeloyl-ACP methyl ester carboxylesterase
VQPLSTDDEVAAVVRGVRCPVHVAYGDAAAGSLVPVAEIDALAAAGMAVTRTHVPGAGHALSPLFPARCHADLRRFLARIH